MTDGRFRAWGGGWLGLGVSVVLFLPFSKLSRVCPFIVLSFLVAFSLLGFWKYSPSSSIPLMSFAAGRIDWRFFGRGVLGVDGGIDCLVGFLFGCVGEDFEILDGGVRGGGDVSSSTSPLSRNLGRLASCVVCKRLHSL